VKFRRDESHFKEEYRFYSYSGSCFSGAGDSPADDRLSILSFTQVQFPIYDRSILRHGLYVVHPPNVIKICSIETMEGIDKAGGDLFSHLQRTEFSEERTKFYAAEIVLGLSALHSANIIYRDLKPENCLLDGSGHLVLVDFGLSKILNSPKNCANTLCGTADYLAPEVLMGEYNVRADWWSLGVIIFEMITQKSPFHSESTLQ
jgi:serine/threonine protein kinase